MKSIPRPLMAEFEAMYIVFRGVVIAILLFVDTHDSDFPKIP